MIGIDLKLFRIVQVLLQQYNVECEKSLLTLHTSVILSLVDPSWKWQTAQVVIIYRAAASLYMNSQRFYLS